MSTTTMAKEERKKEKKSASILRYCICVNEQYLFDECGRARALARVSNHNSFSCCCIILFFSVASTSSFVQLSLHFEYSFPSRQRHLSFAHVFYVSRSIREPTAKNRERERKKLNDSIPNARAYTHTHTSEKQQKM